MTLFRTILAQVLYGKWAVTLLAAVFTAAAAQAQPSGAALFDRVLQALLAFRSG